MDNERTVAPLAQGEATSKNSRQRVEQRAIIVDHTGRPPVSDGAGYPPINSHDHDWQSK